MNINYVCTDPQLALTPRHTVAPPITSKILHYAPSLAISPWSITFCDAIAWNANGILIFLIADFIVLCYQTNDIFHIKIRQIYAILRLNGDHHSIFAWESSFVFFFLDYIIALIYWFDVIYRYRWGGNIDVVSNMEIVILIFITIE